MGLEPIDLSQYFKVGKDESQLYDVASSGVVGPNKFYDCVPASFALCLMALGLPDIEPQDLMDMVYGKGHSGGADFVYFTNRLRQLGVLPYFLGVLNVNPRNTVQAIHDYLVQGFPVIVEFKDDRNAQLVPQWHSDWHGTHASVAVACGPTTISIINVWDGSIQTFPHSIFTQATLDPAGNLVVFQKSILPAPKPVVVPTPPQPVIPTPVVPAPTPDPVVPAPVPLPAPAPTPEPVPDPVPVIPSPPVTPPVPEPAPVVLDSPPVVNPVVEPNKPSNPTSTARKVGRSTLFLGAVVAIATGLVHLLGVDLNSLLNSVLGLFNSISVPPAIRLFLDSPNGVALKVALGWILLDAAGTAILEWRQGRFDPQVLSYFLQKVGGEYVGLAILGILGYLVPLMDLGFGLAILAFTTTESTGAKEKIQSFIDSLKKPEAPAKPTN